jgi:alkylation response protein AidB-like acyl-CoA dehydrogenase
MNGLQFPAPTESTATRDLRHEVREFLKAELGDRRSYSYLGDFDPAFSQALGARGWIGMNFPKRYGGQERSVRERYVVFEELIAARAPVYAHSIAERQSGPLLLRFGTERQREEILPRITAGQCYFCIGMSEPDSGSDLASVRTRASKVDGGYLVNGAKIWTSSAHRSHYMILLCRTSSRSENRHAGLSQFLVDMQAPGIECRQIINMAGEIDFNEVVFTDAFIPDHMLIGKEGEGWTQVTSELAFERSGPERFLSSLGLLEELVGVLQREPSERGVVAVGRLVAHLHTLRRLSRSVSTMLERGDEPALQATIVKDLGTVFEQEIPELARLIVETEPDTAASNGYAAALANVMLRAPSCTIRGGTKEVLRGIIARGIGLR